MKLKLKGARKKSGRLSADHAKELLKAGAGSAKDLLKAGREKVKELKSPGSTPNLPARRSFGGGEEEGGIDEPDEDLKVVSLPVPMGLHVVVVHPALSISTRDARDAVPAHVPIGDAIANLGHLGMLISALYESDFHRLGTSIRDRLHQPYRVPMIEGFDRVYEAAMQAGALGAGISGSGPSVFAFTDAMDGARRCGSAMQAAFGTKQIASECFVSPVGSVGAIQNATS